MQQWVFSAKVKDAKGNLKNLDLVEINETPIKRHVKIRAEATPYDPAYQEYFTKRQQLRKDKSYTEHANHHGLLGGGGGFKL